MISLNKFNLEVNFVLLVIFITFFPSKLFYSQQKHDLRNEIIVYIQPNIMDFSDSIKEELSIDKIKFKSNDLKNTFTDFKIKSIKKAFPDWKDEDTIKIGDKGERISVPHFARIYKVTLSKKDDVDSAISAISKIPGVLYAEKNMGAITFSVDPDYTKQWYLNNTSQTGGTTGEDIQAEEAWQIFTGSSSVKIGIIDTGVETTHDDLSGKTSGDPYDGLPHGTHVAGIAAAKANNIHGGKGVDWNAQIISRRIFTNSEVQQYNPSGYIGNADAADKIIDAVNNGADILNNSWGSLELSTTLRFAFAYAYKMNRVTIAAMDDHGATTPTSPAAFGQGIIAVGATNDIGTRATYSQAGTWIDVSAPGGANTHDLHDIWSTWPGNTYNYLAGTSMATPVVTGIASLLKGYNPSLYNDDIEHIIQLSADDISDPNDPTTGFGWDQGTGYGRVNAKKALDLLRMPYVLNHLTSTGGTIYSSSDYFGAGIYGSPVLGDANYIVKRHEVRKTVYFNSTVPQMFGAQASQQVVGQQKILICQWVIVM